MSATKEARYRALITVISQTTFALANFVLAMLLFPEVQQKAHEELDRVIGRDRLPNVEDEDSLPYTSSVVKELLR